VDPSRGGSARCIARSRRLERTAFEPLTGRKNISGQSPDWQGPENAVQ
jgi:hypothetical protein